MFADLELWPTVEGLLSDAWRSSTKKSYSSAQRRYLLFCDIYDTVPLPASEENILLFIAYLHNQNIKGQSIRCYLSAVRQLHIINYVVPPVNTPRVIALIKGAVVNSAPPFRMSPITIDILTSLLDIVDQRHDALLLKTVMTTLYFGCLRAGEIAVPNDQCFDKALHVTISDITFEKDYFRLFLKRSKTDKFCHGVSVYIGCSGSTICAYCNMVEYFKSLVVQHKSNPLFQVMNGTALSKSYLINATKLLISMLGLNPDLFGGHSYRCGSASTASLNGMNESEIKLLDRWESSVYRIYLRKPELVASFARRLL